MNRLFVFGLLTLALSPGCVTTRGTYYETADGTGVATTEFRQALSPYGEWIEVEGYGRVWRPYPSVVGSEFQPYATGGQWVYTDYGWSFETTWAWGWAPFHYGRWMVNPAYGWVWVPGSVWAPAWVTWRYGGGFVGWAPLPPVGAAIVIERYHPAWCFVETRYLVSPNVRVYAVPAARFHTAFTVTSSVPQQVSYGGARWYAGPPAQHVAVAVGQPIRPAAIAPPKPGTVRPVFAGGHAPAATSAVSRPVASGQSVPSGNRAAPVPSASPAAPNRAPSSVARPPASKGNRRATGGGHGGGRRSR